MLDADSGRVTCHLVLKSGGQYIGPFPPRETYVRHWAETNGYPVDALEYMGEPWRESWDISDYIATDNLPSPSAYMVRVKLEPQWVFFAFENVAKRWMADEGVGQVAALELVELVHSHYLEKEPKSFHPPYYLPQDI